MYVKDTFLRMVSKDCSCSNSNLNVALTKLHLNQIWIIFTHLNLQQTRETKLDDYNLLIRINCHKLMNCAIDSMAVCASNSSIDDDVKNMTVVFENKCGMYGFNCHTNSRKLNMNLNRSLAFLNFVLYVTHA